MEKIKMQGSGNQMYKMSSDEIFDILDECQDFLDTKISELSMRKCKRATDHNFSITDDGKIARDTEIYTQYDRAFKNIRDCLINDDDDIYYAFIPISMYCGDSLSKKWERNIMDGCREIPMVYKKIDINETDAHRFNFLQYDHDSQTFSIGKPTSEQLIDMLGHVTKYVPVTSARNDVVKYDYRNLEKDIRHDVWHPIANQIAVDCRDYSADIAASILQNISIMYAPINDPYTFVESFTNMVNELNLIMAHAKERTCKTCGKRFIIGCGELNYFYSHNLAIPRRCKACRDASKTVNA